MSNIIGTDRVAETIIDEALRTYPLATTPPALLPTVMARIQRLEARPRFRLAWIDYAISLFVAGMIALLVFLWLYLAPQLGLQPQHGITSLLRQPDLLLIWFSLAAGVVLTIIAILTTLMIFAWSNASLTR